MKSRKMVLKYLQGRDSDIENRLVDTARKAEDGAK